MDVRRLVNAIWQLDIIKKNLSQVCKQEIVSYVKCKLPKRIRSLNDIQDIHFYKIFEIAASDSRILKTFSLLSTEQFIITKMKQQLILVLKKIKKNKIKVNSGKKQQQTKAF